MSSAQRSQNVSVRINSQCRLPLRQAANATREATMFSEKGHARATCQQRGSKTRTEVSAGTRAGHAPWVELAGVSQNRSLSSPLLDSTGVSHPRAKWWHMPAGHVPDHCTPCRLPPSPTPVPRVWSTAAYQTAHETRLREGWVGRGSCALAFNGTWQPATTRDSANQTIPKASPERQPRCSRPMMGMMWR